MGQEAIRITLIRKEIPITVMTLDGSEKMYKMREMSAAQRERYLSDIAKNMNFNKKTGKPCGVKSFDGVSSMLLCLCLVDDTGKALSPAQIQEFPATAQTALVKVANEINGLQSAPAKPARKKDEDDEDEEDDDTPNG